VFGARNRLIIAECRSYCYPQTYLVRGCGGYSIAFAQSMASRPISIRSLSLPEKEHLCRAGLLGHVNSLAYCCGQDVTFTADALVISALYVGSTILN
jgi:hypothetical protein